MVYKTLTKREFISEFIWSSRCDYFSFDALSALYDYLDDCDDYELDIIELCGRFSEYASLKKFQDDYCAEEYPTIESIQDNATVIMIDDDSFLVSGV